MPTKPVSIVLSDGKKRSLKYNFNALCALEDEFNISWIELGKTLNSGGDLRTARALIWAGLLHEGEGLSAKDVGNLIELSQMAEISMALTNAFVESFPEADIEADEKKAEGLKANKTQENLSEKA